MQEQLVYVCKRDAVALNMMMIAAKHFERKIKDF
jgi:hypothetical protein